jgi:hypothetical protein
VNQTPFPVADTLLFSAPFDPSVDIYASLPADDFGPKSKNSA